MAGDFEWSRIEMRASLQISTSEVSDRIAAGGAKRRIPGEHE